MTIIGRWTGKLHGSRALLMADAKGITAGQDTLRVTGSGV
jgi:hypothetical protein